VYRAGALRLIFAETIATLQNLIQPLNSTEWRALGRYQAIFAVTQHLVLIGRPTRSSTTCTRLTSVRLERPGFGILISGPSKSTDIEQALVIGAHGARSGSLFLVGS
jgi:hypothetical protein